ncbi:hypothetical protein HMPREF0239_04814 [Clostridium sp. ATCC BAA-442]|nr:hypothetical protein HMPREF0239_04814 [Clostridium sp. ATCC BAA-442]
MISNKLMVLLVILSEKRKRAEGPSPLCPRSSAVQKSDGRNIVHRLQNGYGKPERPLGRPTASR